MDRTKKGNKGKRRSIILLSRYGKGGARGGDLSRFFVKPEGKKKKRRPRTLLPDNVIECGKGTKSLSFIN